MNKSELKKFLNTYLSKDEILTLYFSITRAKQYELVELFYRFEFVWDEIYTLSVEKMNYKMYRDFLISTNFNMKFNLTDMMKNILLDKEVEVNDEDLNKQELLGLNALHLAFWKKDELLAKNLIDEGIDQETEDKYGRVPVDYK